MHEESSEDSIYLELTPTKAPRQSDRPSAKKRSHRLFLFRELGLHSAMGPSLHLS